MRIRDFWCAFFIGLCLVLSFTTSAFSIEQTTVRVGWYEKKYFQEGTADGPKKGYAYEILKTVALYANWDLEFVPGTWEEHVESFRQESGKIDLLFGVPDSPELRRICIFPFAPIISHGYFIYCRQEDLNSYTDMSSLRGKRIGVSVGSDLERILSRWNQTTGFGFVLVPFQDDSVNHISADSVRKKAFFDGKVDLYADVDYNVLKNSHMYAVTQSGNMNDYVGVAHKSANLVPVISRILSIMQSSNPQYFSDLEEKYYHDLATRKMLPISEKIWANEHDQIHVGYFEKYSPFSMTGKNGKEEGIFSDIIKNTMTEYDISSTVIYHAYHSYRQMISDLVFGKIDLAAPIYSSEVRSETYGYSQTKPFLSTTLLWVYKNDSKATLLDHTESLTDAEWKKIRIAISEDTPMQSAVFSDFYSKATAVRVKNWQECVQAVKDGLADGTLLNVYRATTNLHGDSEVHSREVPVRSLWTFGVSRGNAELLQIMDRGITIFDVNKMGESLVHHMSHSGDSFWMRMKLHSQLLIGIACALLGAMILLLIYVKRQKLRVKEIKWLAYHDSVTNLPNKRDFDADWEKLSSKELSPDLVVGCMNVDGFKELKDSLEWKISDQLIGSAGLLLDKFIGPYGTVYFVGGNEFFAFFECSEEELETLNKNLRNALAERTSKKDRSLSISCGFAARRNFKKQNLVDIAREARRLMNKEEMLHQASSRVKMKNGIFQNVAGYEKLFRNEEERMLLDNFVMTYESQYDTLTGLLTMSNFLQKADSPDYEINKPGKTPVMICFNLIGMKGYNSRFGLQEGDVLLIEFAEILDEVYGKEFCSRFGEDRFYVATVTDSLEENVNRVFELMAKCNDGISLNVRAGIYIYDSADLSYASLAADRARVACDFDRGYEFHFTYFNQSMRKRLEMRDFVIFNIDNAIASGHIHAHYQPKVNTVTGELVGFEVLARWIDPNAGFISPADFVPVLEEFGLTYKLDFYIVEQLAKDFRKSFDMGINDVPTSFNLSRMDFVFANPRIEIKKILDKYKVPINYFQVEITESCVMADPQKMREEIKLFRELGFDVLMDDFGSGYSSLGTLRDFEFDEIKIDMSFMRNFDEKSKSIITSIVLMAKKMGLRTLCEGVETQEQVDFLKEVGCEQIQGWFFGKAESYEAVVEKWLKNR